MNKRYVFFTISAVFPETGAEQLNHFLAQHVIESISEQFVNDGQNSFWSVRVAVVDSADQTRQANNTTSTARKRSSVDYRDLLSPEHFAIYARLRTLRNQLAEQDAIPAYAIFTNEQLSEMAQIKQPSMDAIAQIDGVGEKRLTRYASQFLNVLLNNAENTINH